VSTKSGQAHNSFSKHWKKKTKSELFEDFDSVICKIKERTVPEWDKL